MQTFADQIPQFALYVILLLIAVGAILGFGERRKIVVYENYDDLFLTFAVPALAYASFALLSMHDAVFYTLLGYTLAAASFGIFLYTAWRTFRANGGSMWKTPLALLTKFPLAFIWVLQIINVINPSGKTGLQRAQNRASALMILAILTPIVTALVVERTGFFSPRAALKGRRIGGIRDTL